MTSALWIPLQRKTLSAASGFAQRMMLYGKPPPVVTRLHEPASRQAENSNSQHVVILNQRIYTGRSERPVPGRAGRSDLGPQSRNATNIGFDAYD
jgi:hypothetical protein